jgi:hypothetical protein
MKSPQGGLKFVKPQKSFFRVSSKSVLKVTDWNQGRQIFLGLKYQSGEKNYQMTTKYTKWP